MGVPRPCQRYTRALTHLCTVGRYAAWVSPAFLYSFCLSMIAHGQPTFYVCKGSHTSTRISMSRMLPTTAFAPVTDKPSRAFSATSRVVMIVVNIHSDVWWGWDAGCGFGDRELLRSDESMVNDDKWWVISKWWVIGRVVEGTLCTLDVFILLYMRVMYPWHEADIFKRNTTGYPNLR